MTRPDRDSEVVRRNNAIARVQPDRVLLGGLPDEASNALTATLPPERVLRVTGNNIQTLIAEPRLRENQPLEWGKEAIGLGLLRALYERRTIEFGDHDSPADCIKPRSDHLVVCEAGEPLSEVIAANYAYSIGAGMHLFPATDDSECKKILDAYYDIYEPDIDQEAVRKALQERMREICGEFDLPPGGSLTFVTKSLPFGAAFPELPSTHLFAYPDLGIAIVNGFAAEQRGARGTNVAVLVDPERVKAPEIEAAAKLLPSRGMFVRGYVGKGATVRDVAEMIELFPYDLLIFATHCGDANGYRWTYQFRDSEGIDRTLVVDIAIGIARTDDPEMLRVSQFVRFISLDGVDWNDPAAKAELYIGTAITDFTNRDRDDLKWQPVHKEVIPRVIGSAAMAMTDNNYLVMPRSLACEGCPIIINNACVSWHELAGRFMFSNARAYVGTITPVGDSEAEAIVVRVLDKYYGKPLAHAIWSAQNATYGEQTNRRPYVVSGVYTQRLRTTREDTPRWIIGRLSKAARDWQARLAASKKSQTNDNGVEEIVAFYKREVPAFYKRWLGVDGKQRPS